MILNAKFDLDSFSEWIENFLPDFVRDFRKVEIPSSFSDVKSITTLGESNLGVRVFVIETLKDPSGRKVGLAKDSFNLIKNYGTPNALIAYHLESSENWRFSLLTSTPSWNEGKIITKLSNPKRHSYVLGPKAKTNTPEIFLMKRGNILDFEDLKSRFSLEVVNKEFYKEISESFTKLVGGTRGEGKNKKTYESVLKLPSTNDHSLPSIEFAVRLIGRVIFCWFLREKISESGSSLMPKELLSLPAVSENADYYHKILEPIFFEVLNKPLKSRKESYIRESFSEIPYLNGGLFSPHDDDFFSYNEGKQAQFHNTVVVPDKWFKEFFSILETYNFTIDENTSIDEDLSIDPEMLGRIFENLLAEINPETGESARKSTGSYYTPRVVVDYMVDESLLLYLKQKTNIGEVELRAIISYDLSDDALYPLNESEKEALVNAIEKVKILDPACGSGAFPIGALQKIVFILQQIDPEGQIWFHKQIQNTSPEIRRVMEREYSHRNFDYIRKLGIIRENIYGIDIQPIATEISRLRCFLTLVVDERIDDTQENRGIEPLPNLDFKFVTANSLIGLPTSNKQNQIGLFEDTEGINELREIRDMFFNASGTEREMLKLQFMQSQKNMLQKLISENRRGHADLTTMLTTWDPFGHKASSWFDQEWMFGIKEGFDIVIANPPYIGQKGNKSIFDQMKTNPNFEKKMDFWYFFLHLAYDLNKPDGVTTFITTNYWISAQGGKKIRKRIVNDYTIIEWINFNENKIFEAGVHANVFILNKKIPTDNIISCTVYKNRYDNNFFENRHKELNFKTKQSSIYSNWTGFVHFLPKDQMNIINKLIENSEKLSDDKSKGKAKKGITSGKKVTNGICNINQGLVTGKDRASLANGSNEGVFILTENEIRNLNLTSNEKTKVKPFYKNSDIKRYYVSNKPSYYILYINDIEKEEELKNFPNIYTHICKYKDLLKKRSINGVLESAYKKGKWWALTTDRPNIDFSGEKIVFPQRSSLNTFGFSKEEWYAASDVFYVSLNREKFFLEYILSIINSKLMFFWLYNMGKRKGETLELTLEPIQFIPIKIISDTEQAPFIQLVNKIITITSLGDYFENLEKQREVFVYENQIDQMVYKLYGLTEDEIKVVESKSNDKTVN